MWVLKLGGSLYHTPQLMPWLQAIADLASPPVVVPGGGPFADSVRLAQKHLSFDNATAHRMAILGMEQMGHMLCSLQPGLQGVADPDAMLTALHNGKVPVWLPGAMTQDTSDLTMDWDVTSDSLAAWLAGQLAADGVVLVKSAELESGEFPLTELQDQGVLDKGMLRHQNVQERPLWLMNRFLHDKLGALLSGTPDGCVSVI